MRLDPVQQDDPVGGQSVLIEVDRQAEAVGAERGRRHLRPDRTADPRFGHAQFGQHRALAVGRPSAVRAHRRDHERRESQLLQRIHRRPGDRVDTDNPSTADRQGDRPAWLDPAGDPVCYTT